MRDEGEALPFPLRHPPWFLIPSVKTVKNSVNNLAIFKSREGSTGLQEVRGISEGSDVSYETRISLSQSQLSDPAP